VGIVGIELQCLSYLSRLGKEREEGL